MSRGSENRAASLVEGLKLPMMMVSVLVRHRQTVRQQEAPQSEAMRVTIHLSTEQQKAAEVKLHPDGDQ
jgi:hypothetical protein